MLFEPWQLANVRARNRVVRSATYEGLGDESGRPRRELGELYRQLADGGVGTIVTGFCYVSRRGRAMQPRQCGINSDDKIAPWEAVVSTVREASEPTVMLMQLAHTGLQTLPRVTGLPAMAPSVRRSPYFRTRPVKMTESDIREVIEQFAAAADRARRAGFDGVQLHAAHGYLIHQFLSPCRNGRTDRWGADRFAFLAEVIRAVKDGCGETFPVFVKISAGDGHRGGVSAALAGEYAARMAELGVEAVEVSYGTMDQALDIFRGGVPIEKVLQHNILFCRKPAWMKRLWKRFVFPRMKRQLIPFTENYNLKAARTVRRAAKIPLILVGGLRRLDAMETILESGAADAIALCRPLICQPDLPNQLKTGRASRSACVHCNLCAVMCDSTEPLRCYQKESKR